MAAKKEPARARGGFKASRHGDAPTSAARASASGNKAEQKRAAEQRESKSHKVGTKAVSSFLRGKKIDPRKIDGTETVVQLVDGAFQSYNSGRLREGCQLFTELMLGKNVTVGMTLTGALTPAGLGMSTIIPLMEAGFVDWIISTGANLYHDTHFGLGLSMHRGNPTAGKILRRLRQYVLALNPNASNASINCWLLMSPSLPNWTMTRRLSG